MWTIPLTNVDTQQVLLHLPLGTVAAVPASYLAEFTQPNPNTLVLSFVDPDTPAWAKRYKIVRHHSGAWTSVPRPWLRDLSARDGDILKVTRPTTTTFALELVRATRI